MTTRGRAATGERSRAWRALWVGAGLLVKGLWISTMIAVPLLGMWLSSSLAAYNNSSLWLSLGIGVLLFPVLPIAWDQWSLWRRRKRDPGAKRLLTTLDRLVLRTLALNVAFIAVVLWVAPRAAFRAVCTRGDWMLRDSDAPAANRVRGYLFAIADGLEVLYGRGGETRYGKSDAPPRFGDTPPGATAVWPPPARLHAAVTAIPPGVETDYRSVARHLASVEHDPIQLVKALHDYVIVRLAYDYEMLAAVKRGEGVRSSQEPDDVFSSRRAVCAGFAKLLAAMGKEVGVEIAYVTGQGSRDGTEVDGSRHAWNAARIDGSWYLIDATWDDDTRSDYETTYLFTPPELFGLDHFPEESQWQLRSAPLSRSEFMRQPMIRPGFALLGLKLLQPRRSQVTASGRVDVVVENPHGAYLLATVAPAGEEDQKKEVDCEVRREELTRITCQLPHDGRFLVRLYGNTQRSGSYDHIAKLLVNNR